jgi:phosphatidylglycerol:prolipoprotein diacylglycerol transferase
MLETLLYLPEAIAGMPVFGAGLLLALWAVGSVVFLAFLLRKQGLSADTLSYVALLGVIGLVIWQVLPRIVEPRHGLPIRGYGMMLLLSVVAGTGLSLRRSKQVGLDPGVIYTLIFWGFIPGLIGARLFFVVEYWQDFSRPTLGATLAEIANLTKGGLVIFGAFLFGMAGFFVYLTKQKLPVLATVDLVSPGMLLGLAIGRIGCLFHGCCYGAECELPWAVTFPATSPPFVNEFERGEVFLQGLKIDESDERATIAAVEPGSPAERAGLAAGMEITRINGNVAGNAAQARELLMDVQQHGGTVSIAADAQARAAEWAVSDSPSHTRPLHPTQLYASIGAFLLCLFLLAYDPFRRRDGELLALVLTIHPIDRFLTEFIRTDEPGQWGTGLSIGQIVSLGLFVAGIALWIYLSRQPRRKAFPSYAT